MPSPTPTIALAVVAALAFAVTVWQTIESRKSIETATKATEAAVRQAIATEKLLDETLVNRELDWRPMLVWVRRHGNIWNTGRGPGYRVVVADGRDKPTMHVSQPIPVGAGPSQNEIDAFTWIDYNDWPSGKLPDGAEWGVFCEDQFRNRFRFLDKGEPPDICHPRTSSRSSRGSGCGDWLTRRDRRLRSRGPCYWMPEDLETTMVADV